ncbi:MAG: type II toxin-antitoxin system HicA family toxin [Bacteroidales bacterium]|nr:type II toxin-antitoxin system HicA family toxin [Bacteroidales bacterium]
MKTNELKRLLRAYGCQEIQVNARGHDVWYSPISNAQFRVPRHQSREIANGTCSAILKQAGIKL